MALLAVGFANTWPSHRFSGPHNGVLFCLHLKKGKIPHENMDFCLLVFSSLGDSVSLSVNWGH